MRLLLLRLALGIALGALLVACVAAGPAELLELPAGSPQRRHAARALAWLVAAGVLGIAGPVFERGKTNGDLLLGAAAGVFAHGFLRTARGPAGGRGGARGSPSGSPCATARGAWAARRRPRSRPNARRCSSSPGSWPRARRRRSRPRASRGRCACSAPATPPTTRCSRSRSPLLATIGGTGVARLCDTLARGRARGGRTVALLAALGGVGAYQGVGFLGGVAAPAELRDYLRGLGLDAVGARDVGSTTRRSRPLRSSRSPSPWAPPSSSRAGPSSSPHSPSAPPRGRGACPRCSRRSASRARVLVRAGALAGAAGCALAFAGRPSVPRARALGLGSALAIAFFAALVPVRPLHVLRPWAAQPVAPDWIGETPAGLWALTGASSDLPEVALDGVALTPAAERAPADAERIRLALELVPAQRREGMSVLLVGPLTPGRALALSTAGAERVDRVTAGMPAELEGRMFAGPGLGPPAGELLDVPRARANLDAGAYDLVLVPPAAGRAPRVRAPGAPLDTITVLWLDAAGDLASRPLARPVLVALHELEDLCAGVTWGIAPPSTPRPGEVCALPADEPLAARAPLARLGVRERDRPRLERARFTQRLARASRAGEWAVLTTGLARLYAAQRRSSPFESAAERTELDDDALNDLRSAALARRPDELTRTVWNALARVLAGKRDVERIDAYLEPIARAHPPWKELELALALADLEALEPERAVERLAPFVAAEPGDPELAALFARAQEAAGD